MAFEEDLNVFVDASGFAVRALLDGVEVNVLPDAPGADLFGGSVVTTEPSVLLKASDGATDGMTLVLDQADLPAQMAHMAGTYTVRSVLADSLDGAFVRCMLVRS